MSFADLTSNLEKDVETVYGRPDPSRNVVKNARRVIVKASLISLHQLMLSRIETEAK